MELVDLYDENRVPWAARRSVMGKGTRGVPGGGSRVRVRPSGPSADPTADTGEDSLAGALGCTYIDLNLMNDQVQMTGAGIRAMQVII